MLRLLELTPKQAEQTGFFEADPGQVDRRSTPEVKVDFVAALFAARTDIYATRWENARTRLQVCRRAACKSADTPAADLPLMVNLQQLCASPRSRADYAGRRSRPLN